LINKGKFILFPLFLLIIAIPIGFASDINENATGEVIGDTIDAVNVSSSDEFEILGDSDVYFDASASSGGDGSQSRPYNTVTSSYLGTTNHFKSGTYRIASSLSSSFGFSSSPMSFIGDGRDTTVLQFVGSGAFMTTGSDIAFSGLTLKGCAIESSGGLITATDTIFDGGTAVEVTESDNNKYGNSYGGAIKQMMSSSSFDWGSIFGGGSSKSGMNFNNCIFRNNYAAYGGAIYSEKGTVTITNSRFEGNHADNGGGAVAALNGVNLTIDNCEFLEDYSTYDAGGAVYLFNVSSANIQNSQFANCHAAIGGAISSLISPITIFNSTFNKNGAGWIGGAVFGMYGNLTSSNSDYSENSAYHGGAIYADNLTSFEVNGGIFSKNSVNGSAGAIFAFTNAIDKIINATYISNSASEYDDLYQSASIGLILGSDEYEMVQYKSSYSGSLPSRYDLRAVNGVTPVKNQGQSGNCWAFATIATLESAILKATGREIILSEGNLKNLANKYSDIGWDYETNNGGMYPFVYGYLTSWAGPVLASLDPTDDWDVVSPIINSAFHVQNILFLQRTSFTDNNAIKKAIMDYGAVCSEIYWSNSYLSGNNYYYNGNEGRNHAISVVGWDDSKVISGAPGNGAWIVKNSYGSSHGDGGYYYVSYYDKTLFKVYDESYNSFAVVFNDTVRFNKNYQYDAAFTDYYLTGSMNKVMWYKNTFTSTGNDILAAFSTYFRKLTDWEAQIFVNDELRLIQSGKSNPGYYTINLNEDIPLKFGDTFTISIRIKCSSSADIPISESGLSYTLVKEYFKPGISFFSTDGVTWTDFYNHKSSFGSGETVHNYFNQVACIKAFTKDGPKEFLNTTIEIVNVNSTAIAIKVLDQRGGLVNVGKVEVFIDGERKLSNVSKSLSIINSYLKPGNHDIQANFIENQYYNSSSISKIVNLGKETPILIITAENIEYGQELNVMIDVTNAIGERIDVSVSVEVNGRRYNDKQFRISGLSPKDYYINVQTVETDDFNAKFSNKVVKVFKANPQLEMFAQSIVEGQSAVIQAYLPNEIIGNISLLIDSRYFTSNLLNGEAEFVVDGLALGKHQFEVNFEGDSKYNPKNASGSIEVLKKPKMDVIMNVTESINANSLIIDVELPGDVDGNVTFNIKSLAFTKMPVNGKISFRINGLDNGLYNYTVKFEGDDEYNSLLVRKSVLIDQRQGVESTIMAKDMSRAYLSGNDFEAVFTDVYGNPLDNKEVLFVINGNEHYIKTNKYGFARLSLNYTVGTFEVNIFNLITGESAVRTMTIVDRITGNKNIVMDYDDGSVFKVRVYADNANVVGQGEKVTFRVDCKSYNVATDKNGYAYLKLDLKPKTYTITAIYRGVSVLNKIVVKHILKAKNISKKKAKKIKFSVALKSSKGKALSGKKIVFKIKGKKYSAKTNKRGMATVTLKNLKIGKYRITSTYLKSSISNTIKIKK
jgi:predicted outer membrane repeat protein